MRLGVVEYFDTAHYLPGHETCNRMHGHTYRLEVVLEGEKKGGMLMDFQEVKEKVQKVVFKLDHRVMNELLDYPSAENILELIFEKLKEELDYPLKVKLWEGKGKWVEISEHHPKHI